MNLLSTRKNVTLADLAKAAGISKTTASHALSGKGSVSPSTRQIVEKLAQEMGFQADPLARLLSNGRSEKTIGFFTLDIDLSQRTRQLQLIQSHLNDRGYSVPIYAYGYRGSNNATTQLELVNSLISQRPRAIVCNTSAVLPQVFEPIKRFISEGGAVVCYGYGDFVPLDCDQIIYAEGDSFYLATRHLLELGHREIGLFSVGLRKPSGETLIGFKRALSEFNAVLREEWLFGNDGTLRYEEDGERLGKEYLGLDRRPSAMVIANDYAAAAFTATVVRGGVEIPAQLSVVGHDNDAIAPFAVVPLTTISAPVESLAEKVVELLESRLLADYKGAARKIVTYGELIERCSTGQCASVS